MTNGKESNRQSSIDRFGCARIRYPLYLDVEYEVDLEAYYNHNPDSWKELNELRSSQVITIKILYFQNIRSRCFEFMSLKSIESFDKQQF